MLYADFNSTSPISDRVRTRMLPFLGECFANPSNSWQPAGRQARDAIEQARESVARLLDAATSEVVFTSGGTESCAHAIIGAYKARGGEGAIVISAVEHPAVREAARFLHELLRAPVEVVPVSADGTLDLDALERTLEGARPAVVSMMLANNETGVVFPITETSRLAKQFGATVHCDAVQGAGKLAISVRELGVDLLSVSAHKFGGPKGVGALVLRNGTPWEPVVKGGAQEGGRRGGTESPALIAGMGEAADESAEHLAAGGSARIEAIRDCFETELTAALPDAVFNGRSSTRLPNTSSVCIPGAAGQQVAEALLRRGMVISTGSACKSASVEPSFVLSAMGRSTTEALGTLRVSFGAGWSEDAAVLLARAIAEEVRSARALQEEEVARRFTSARTKPRGEAI